MQNNPCQRNLVPLGRWSPYPGQVIAMAGFTVYGNGNLFGIFLAFYNGDSFDEVL